VLQLDPRASATANKTKIAEQKETERMKMERLRK
jgi:hypothetical protein